MPKSETKESFLTEASSMNEFVGRGYKVVEVIDGPDGAKLYRMEPGDTVAKPAAKPAAEEAPKRAVPRRSER